MTAQEAAKEGWSAIKNYRWAVGFVGVGALLAAAGMYSNELKEIGGLVGGIAMQALGVASYLMERTAKKTASTMVEGQSEQVSSQVYTKLRTDLDDMRDAHTKSAAAMVNLASVFAESEVARQRMHEENMGRAQSIHDRLDEHGEAINSLGEAMASLKQGWQIPPVKGREKR